MRGGHGRRVAARGRRRRQPPGSPTTRQPPIRHPSFAKTDRPGSSADRCRTRRSGRPVRRTWPRRPLVSCSADPGSSIVSSNAEGDRASRRRAGSHGTPGHRGSARRELRDGQTGSAIGEAAGSEEVAAILRDLASAFGRGYVARISAVRREDDGCAARHCSGADVLTETVLPAFRARADRCELRSDGGAGAAATIRRIPDRAVGCLHFGMGSPSANIARWRRYHALWNRSSGSWASLARRNSTNRGWAASTCARVAHAW